MYVVDVYGGIRCETVEEALAIVSIFNKDVARARAEAYGRVDWHWHGPMHQPVHESEGE